MRSSPSRRPGSPIKTVSLVLGTLLAGGAVTLGGLWASGVEMPFLKWEPDHRGMVAVPITTRTIPAFSRVTRDDFLLPDQGVPRYMYLPPDVATSLGVITEFNKITGRVLDHEKPPGYPFTEKDFLPKGTRAGLVAGIPAGKRAVTVDATKIQGIHALKVGDRLDLLASQSVDMQKALSAQARGGSNLQMGLLSQEKRASVRVLVQNGALISPVTTRVVPISSNSLTQGAVTRTKPIQEVVIAVDPEEIAQLTEAVSVEANITCVARSGLPDDPGEASITPSGPSPSDQFAAVERIVGGAREVMFIPRSGVRSGDSRGMVTVPLCGKPIAMNTKVTADQLLDPATNRPHLVSLRPGDVRRLGLVTDPSKIVGRVLGRRKDPDSAFKEEDFLPDAPEPPKVVTTVPATRPSLLPGSSLGGQ